MILVNGIIFILFFVSVIIIILVDKIKACFKIARIIFGILMRNGHTVLIYDVGLVLRVLISIVRHILVVRTWKTVTIHLRATLRAAASIIDRITILVWIDRELLAEST